MNSKFQMSVFETIRTIINALSSQKGKCVNVLIMLGVCVAIDRHCGLLKTKRLSCSVCAGSCDVLNKIQVMAVVDNAAALTSFTVHTKF